MGLDRLFSLTAAGIPVALWLFVAVVTVVSVFAAVRWVGRPARADQGA